MEVNVWTVFVAASFTALATGLGALPFFVFSTDEPLVARDLELDRAASCSARALRCSGRARTSKSRERSLGALVGVAFIEVTRRRLGHQHEHLHLGVLRGADARAGLLIVTVMTVHSFTEGVGVGVSFGGGEALGAFITTAIAVHNIPEGLAISLVLVPRGVTAWRAAGWSVFTSLPQPLMAVPAFLLVEWFAPLLPAGLGFAGGAMVWMVAVELVPEAREDLSDRSVAAAIAASMAMMVAFQLLVLA